VICRSLFIVFLFVLVHCLSFFDLLFWWPFWYLHIFLWII
jgi:hypothetical protein